MMESDTQIYPSATPKLGKIGNIPATPSKRACRSVEQVLASSSFSGRLKYM